MYEESQVAPSEDTCSQMLSFWQHFTFACLIQVYSPSFYCTIKLESVGAMNAYASSFASRTRKRKDWCPTCFVFLKNIAQTYLISKRMHRGTMEKRIRNCDIRNCGSLGNEITWNRYELSFDAVVTVDNSHEGYNEFGIDSSRSTRKRSWRFSRQLFLEFATTRILWKKPFKWDQKCCFTKRYNLSKKEKCDARIYIHIVCRVEAARRWSQNKTNPNIQSKNVTQNCRLDTRSKREWNAKLYF